MVGNLRSMRERFWPKVQRGGDDECWPWLAAVDSDGYGQFTDEGLNISAHRASWRINRGPIPKGKWVLHKCDNRKCVNPRHLYIGTAIDNTHDMFVRGRAKPRGKPQRPQAKLAGLQMCE